MKRIFLSTLAGGLRRARSLLHILLAAAVIPATYGAQPPTDVERPAIAELDEIRTELLRQVDQGSNEPRASGGSATYQWPNWPNWGNWRNWNNWNNWTNWGNWGNR
jgi:hypothetical protein